MRRRHVLFTAPLLVSAALSANDAAAAPTLGDYRYFRALSLDLQGRVPTRAEVAAFEQPGFDVDGWIDAHAQGPAFSSRVRQIYMDLLRLEIGPTFQFVQPAEILRSYDVLAPDGKSRVRVYFRDGQRRSARDQGDGVFCFAAAETGMQYPKNAAATPVAGGAEKPIAQADLDKWSKVVKPWWLYRDYRAADPKELYGMGWEQKAGFQLPPTMIPGTLKSNVPNDTLPVTEIRVCNEEAQEADTGTIYVSGRPAPKKGDPPPYDRKYPLPLDSAYAKAHPNEPISCTGGTALGMAADCGCGRGLERCLPGLSYGFDSSSLDLAPNVPLGEDAPFDNAIAQSTASWERRWWNQEAAHFLDDVIGGDRDFRDVLLSHDTFVNGPLTQFYTAIAPSTCCGAGTSFGLVTPEPLFDPKSLPALLPTDVSVWKHVVDRGPHASGILTMPVFLAKFGSRRARAHVLYQTFLCRDFIAENLQLAPSTNPNLMERPGCSTCHVKLEPLASYFTRVMESDWTYLPPDKFPLEQPKCAKGASGIPGSCTNYYDPAFTDGTTAKLRGSYGSPTNAEAGPAGIGQLFTSAPEFPGCVAQNVASAFLGRSLTSEDAALQSSLADVFTQNGYRMTALVKALVRSDAYKHGNDLSSTSWRAAR